ncbi:MAG: lysylphosphatidylglycerol synthase transmembrane domain-containing protein [Flavobacteriaceae bacterium]|nr:lysylphosphatidylglycerol synthase transmembrane domain-containing protein [Flavobacteriaceae bacterium]
MNFKSFLKFFVPLLLGAFFVYLSIHITTEEDRKMILRSIKNADIKFVALGLFFSILSHLSRAYRWKFLLSPMGYSPRLINTILCVFVAYLANLGVPRSGEVIRASFLSNYEKIPFEKAFGSIVIERVIDVIILLLLILIALVLQHKTIWTLIVEKNINFSQLALFGISIIVIVFLLGYSIKKSKSQFVNKIKSIINGFWEGLSSIKKMEKKLPFIFHTVFIWIMYLSMFYVIKWTIPGTFELTVEMIIPAFVIGGLSIATTNGGVGIYPLSVALVLVTFGIGKEVGLAFGWIMWSSQTVLIIICGAFSFIALPFVNRKRYI